MLTDYENQYYHKLAERHERMKVNDFHLAKELAGWKKRMVRSWNDIEVLSVKQFEPNQENIVVGQKYCASVELDVRDLRPEEVGVELVVVNPIEGNKVSLK